MLNSLNLRLRVRRWVRRMEANRRGRLHQQADFIARNCFPEWNLPPEERCRQLWERKQ